MAVAALSAAYGFNSWRRQLIGGKQAEVAEKLLVSFYEIRDIIDAARSPASYEDEGKERLHHPSERPEEERRRNAYYAPAERLYKEREAFVSLNACRYRALAFFGAQIAPAFETVTRLRAKIIVSAQMLATTPSPYFESADGIKNRHAWEKDIWLTEPATDEIKRQMDDAVRSIERICRPILIKNPYGMLGTATNWVSSRVLRWYSRARSRS